MGGDKDKKPARRGQGEEGVGLRGDRGRQGSQAVKPDATVRDHPSQRCSHRVYRVHRAAIYENGEHAALSSLNPNASPILTDQMRLEISTGCTQMLSQKTSPPWPFQYPCTNATLCYGAWRSPRVHACSPRPPPDPSLRVARRHNNSLTPVLSASNVSCPRERDCLPFGPGGCRGATPQGRASGGGGVGVSRPSRSVAPPRASTAPVRQRAAHAVPPLETDRG